MNWTPFSPLVASIFPRRPGLKRRVVALTVAVSAIGGSLCVSDRTTDRHAAANSVPPLHLRPANGERPISLRDRLIVGLQARLESEIEFIDLVVLLVRTGKVPQRIVDQSFFWARGRAARVQNGNPRRAIIYFRPAMIARLRRLDIAL